MTVLTRRPTAATAAGVAAAALACLLLGTGTWAAFTARHTGPGGTLAAGTLDLDVGGFAVVHVFDSPINPGQVVHRSVTVRNTGSIRGRLTETFTLIGAENGCTAAETAAGGCSSSGAGNLREPDQLQVSRDGVHYVPVNAMLASGWQPSVDLDPGASVVWDFSFTLPDNAHNDRVQSDLLNIQSVARLDQIS